jgi:NAD(P)-dependent dehydrogenase (short-subunit alcohol dehydrogenase family)
VIDSKPLAVVTGASSGIGRELARQFATDGFDVIIAVPDRRTPSSSSGPAGSANSKLQLAAARLLPDQARAATHATMTKPEGE